MGFLDKIMDATKDVLGERGEDDNISDGITDLFKGEGLKGVLDKFKDKGFDDIFSSWIGKGENKMISTDQIKEVFSLDKITGLAEKLGLPEDKVTNYLKEYLPGVFDKATPNGVIEDEE